MLRVEKKWCSECCERTNHNYVGSKSDYEGLGIARAILAVGSLGISETVCRDKYWQCCKCGVYRRSHGNLSTANPCEKLVIIRWLLTFLS